MTKLETKTKIAAAASLAMVLFAGATNAATPVAQTITETTPQTVEAEAEMAPAWRSFGCRSQACRFANRVRRCGGVVYRIFYDSYAGWWVVEYS